MKNVRQSTGTRGGQRSRNGSLVRGAIKNRHYRGKETKRGRALDIPKHMRRVVKQADKARALAASVGRCRRGRRCLSPACPQCAQAAQALLASIAKKFVREHDDECFIAFVTVIPRNSLVRKGALHAFNLANFKRRVRDGFVKPSALWAIGSVDFTLNERQYGSRELNWLPHVHLIVATYNIDVLARDLRAAFPRSDHAPRPVMVKEWDGDARVFEYIFKANFSRRISIEKTQRFNKKTGKNRACRGTTYGRLRVSERIELALYLDAVGLDGRLLFRNARLYRTEKSVRIQLTTS